MAQGCVPHESECRALADNCLHCQWRRCPRCVSTWLLRRTASEGDLTLVSPTPSYVAGTKLKFDGGEAVVIEDQCDVVVLATPETNYLTRTGAPIKVQASRINVAKSVIVLEMLK
jgi:hypothetical protein